MSLTENHLARILAWITGETGFKPFQVENTVALFREGATVPFIARYRKERTGELDEVAIRAIEERLAYFTELEERRITVLKSIEEQGKLTPELQARIEATRQKTETGGPLPPLQAEAAYQGSHRPGAGARTACRYHGRPAADDRDAGDGGPPLR